MKVVIVGGVAGGASAAARLRRLDEQAQIIVLERSGEVSYANCGLPYYIGDVIEDEEELTLQTPESFRKRFRIEVRTHHEVTAIDTENKTITVLELETGNSYQETYDKLILSPGAKPIQPDLCGVNHERIFTIRTVKDALDVKHFINEFHPKSVVVAGGGYIGLEMAENLSQVGIAVTIVQKQQHLLAPLDSDMASFVHTQVRKHGITLRLGETVSGFATQGDAIKVQIDGKDTIQTDMVILAIGVVPDSSIAKACGLTMGEKDGILVNDHMQTSDPDIYAVGDAVVVTHSVTGSDALISLAGPANKQGRIAADNICGIDSVYRGSQGSSIVKLFQQTIATTGINERQAKEAGIHFEKIILSPASHATYYPNAKVMTMKVLFEKKSLELLGAQIVGYEGVDKRIDVLATAIYAGIPGNQLKDLDLSYAPPFSSAKDPVNMVGFIIENITTGKLKQFHYEDIEAIQNEKQVTLLDVRTPLEYAAGRMNGFINIPLDSLRERLHELPHDHKIYVMCQSGVRSYLACRILTQNGFDCYNFSGGYRFISSIQQEKEAASSADPCGIERE